MLVEKYFQTQNYEPNHHFRERLSLILIHWITLLSFQYHNLPQISQVKNDNMMIQFWWSSRVVYDLVNVSKFQNIRSCNMGIYYNLVTMMNYEQLHYTDLCDLVRRASRNKPFICLGEVLEMEIREEPAH